MEYRILGRSGLRVSVLGVGGHEFMRLVNSHHYETVKRYERAPDLDEERLSTQPERTLLLRRAVEAGVNYFDTGEADEPQSLGLALKELGIRDRVNIAAETLWPLRRLAQTPREKWRDMVSDWVDERLRLLQTHRVDVFNVHEVENGYTRAKFEFLIEALREIKEEGKIRAIGAASHDPCFLAELIRRYDCLDSIMVRYNYHLQEARSCLFPLCKALDVGVIAMKPLAWPYYGIPFQYFSPSDAHPGPMTFAQTSLKWILQSLEVSTVVPSAQSVIELDENLNTLNKEGPVREDLLKGCLDSALSPWGRARLEELKKLEGVAKTRAHIRLYSRRALGEVTKASINLLNPSLRDPDASQ
jgi:aryl-alcohol dehydrogenase-like predicted oxidoreductase